MNHVTSDIMTTYQYVRHCPRTVSGFLDGTWIWAWQMWDSYWAGIVLAAKLNGHINPWVLEIWKLKIYVHPFVTNFCPIQSKNWFTRITWTTLCSLRKFCWGCGTTSCSHRILHGFTMLRSGSLTSHNWFRNCHVRSEDTHVPRTASPWTVTFHR